MPQVYNGPSGVEQNGVYISTTAFRINYQCKNSSHGCNCNLLCSLMQKEVPISRQAKSGKFSGLGNITYALALCGLVIVKRGLVHKIVLLASKEVKLLGLFRDLQASRFFSLQENQNTIITKIIGMVIHTLIHMYVVQSMNMQNQHCRCKLKQLFFYSCFKNFFSSFFKN